MVHPIYMHAFAFLLISFNFVTNVFRLKRISDKKFHHNLATNSLSIAIKKYFLTRKALVTKSLTELKICVTYVWLGNTL